MTEKRFKLFIGDNYGVQSNDGEVFIDSIISIGDADVLVDLLNEQHETIQQLKQTYSDAKSDVEKYEQILKDIIEDNLLIQDMKKELEND